MGKIYDEVPMTKKTSKSNICNAYEGIWRIDVWKEAEQEK